MKPTHWKFLSVLCIVVIVLISVVLYTTILSEQNSWNMLKDQNELVESQRATINRQTADLFNKGQKIEYQQSTIKQLNNTAEEQKTRIDDMVDELWNLRNEVGSLNQILSLKSTQLQLTEEELAQISNDLESTQGELAETSRLLDLATEFEDRVMQGIDRSKSYLLLGQYEKTVSIVSTFTDVYPATNDVELWSRAADIYNWLGEHYSYCSDKGFCVGNNCYQLQYFSPDELLYYGAQDVLCGDCDDYAQLFVGMMYASGVPHDKARVECGLVPVGGHCWAAVNIDSQWYRIDPVCSDPAKYIDFFGYQIQISGEEFPEYFSHVDCFDSYQLTNWYTAEEFHQ
ncbi:MAG: hypothetical protein JXC85_05750 [Candidatus Aenigmarchaeota archaeon]|nr:hypothetical protein [Candidatus Aenigmarchaeota archaeon]